MANTNRDRLIKTFMSRNRRKGKGSLDQGFPKNPGGSGGSRPSKASAVTDTTLYRARVGPPGGPGGTFSGKTPYATFLPYKERSMALPEKERRRGKGRYFTSKKPYSS